jgi:hypothetical protein
MPISVLGVYGLVLTLYSFRMELKSKIIFKQIVVGLLWLKNEIEENAHAIFFC